MGEQLWSAYDAMGRDCQERAAESAYNAHYDRPAVLAALGPVRGLRVLDAACGPEGYQKLTTEPGFVILRLLKPKDPIPAIRPIA